MQTIIYNTAKEIPKNNLKSAESGAKKMRAFGAFFISSHEIFNKKCARKKNLLTLNAFSIIIYLYE